MRRHSRTIAALGAVLAGLTMPAANAGAATPTITEYPIGTTPGGIASSIDGSLWAPVFADNRIGRIFPYTDPVQTQVTQAGIIPAGAGPLLVAVDTSANVWFTEPLQNKIGRISPPYTAAATEFTVPTANAVPTSIIIGPDANLWFTESGANKIGRISPSGSITEFPVPTGMSEPNGITAGPDRNLWFTEKEGDQVGRINPFTATTTTPGITEYEIPADSSEPSGIAAGPDGNLWFVEPNAGQVGRINPFTATPAAPGITEYPVDGNPKAVTAGPDGNLWVTRDADKIGRLDPATGTVTDFSDGITAGSQPGPITTGADGNLWFTENGANRVARITTAVDQPRFTNQTRINVPGSGDTGPANLYPSTISVGGLQGTVTDVKVRLNGLHHSYGTDVQAMLVGPGGQKSLLMAGRTGHDPITGDVITFARGGRAFPGRLTSGIYAPAGSGNLSSPAPTGAQPNLSAFDGTNPNGDWKLFVDDKGNGDTGAISRGWSLDVETTGPPAPASQGGGAGSGAPGGGTGTGPIVPGPAKRDTTKPKLKLAKLAAKTTLAKFRKGVAASITPSEASTVKCTLATTARKPKTLATVTRKGAKAGKATKCTLKPSKKKLGKPKKAFKVKLSIAATDAAGNKGTASKTITVKP